MRVSRESSTAREGINARIKSRSRAVLLACACVPAKCLSSDVCGVSEFIKYVISVRTCGRALVTPERNTAGHANELCSGVRVKRRAHSTRCGALSVELFSFRKGKGYVSGIKMWVLMVRLRQQLEFLVDYVRRYIIN